MDLLDNAKVNRDAALVTAIAALSNVEAVELTTLLKLNEDKPEEWPFRLLPFPVLS